MANQINMYRLFDEDLHQALKPNTSVSFFYINEHEKLQTLHQKIDHDHKLLLYNDEDSWDYFEHGFGLFGELTFQQPYALFAPDGLANEDAEIGVALQWTSRQSSQRGVVPLANITASSARDFIVPIHYYFSKDKLFGEILLEIVFYLSKSSEQPSRGQASLAGTILGGLKTWPIILDGAGSSFPVVIVNEPDKPLWYVEFQYTEPLIEPFDKEYITICTNKAHPAFSQLQRPETKLAKALKVEFLAGAMQLIFENIMACSDWHDIQNGMNCEEGSIGEAIHYFYSTSYWDFNSPEKFAASLRKDFQARLEGES
ncbi:hypothetical protein ACIGC1_07205 [Peribacillus butanolivorans]|uniref:hypothetical protein n=1 Tax=Peribacillus butanolivorans TaxID=421767 RepID=UPI0037CC2971